MSSIDLSQLVVLPLLDILPAEPGAVNMHAAHGASFDDYLQRARNSSIGNGRSGTSTSGSDAGQPQAPRVEEDRSAATSASLPPKSDDERDDINNTVLANDIDDKESADKENPIQSENPHSENKAEPAGEERPASQPDKKEDDKEKDELDRRADMQTNSVFTDANKGSMLGEETSAPQVEMKEPASSLHIAPEGAKEIVDRAALTEAGTLTENISKNAGAEEGDLSGFGVTKGKASKNGKNAGVLSAEILSGENGSSLVESETSTAKTTKDISESPHKVLRKTARHNEKKEPSGARGSERAASAAVSQDAPAANTPGDPLVLQAAANTPMAPIKPTDIKLEMRKSNASSNANADVQINDNLSIKSEAKTSAGTPQHKGGETTPQLDRVRFVQRVERAFAAIGDRGGSLRLKLSPPELGSVRMEITVSKGVMKARLEAETNEAKNLLLENLPALRERLAQQNIKIQKFDVDMRDPASGGMPQQTAHQAETGSRDGGYRAPRQQARDKNDTAATNTETARRVSHSGQLNVII